MPATITATGTWSVLQVTNALSQAPGAITRESMAQHRDTTEERYQQTSLAGRTAFLADLDGFQEVMEFAGLMAAAYSVPVGVCLMRIRAIIAAMNQSESLEDQRLFAN